MIRTAGGTAWPECFVPQPEPPATELVERKVCEGGCGGYFWRPRPLTAKHGVKICPACRERFARKKEPERPEGKRARRGSKWDRVQ